MSLIIRQCNTDQNLKLSVPWGEFQNLETTLRKVIMHIASPKIVFHLTKIPLHIFLFYWIITYYKCSYKFCIAVTYYCIRFILNNFIPSVSVQLLKNVKAGHWSRCAPSWNSHLATTAFLCPWPSCMSANVATRSTLNFLTEIKLLDDPFITALL